MLSNPSCHVDYSQPGVWEMLAARSARLAPVPTRQCGHELCEPSWHWRPNLHDYDLWYVTRGAGTMELGERTYPLFPNTLMLLRPGDIVFATHEPRSPLSVTYLHFDFFVPSTDERAVVDGAWLPGRCVRFADANLVATLQRAIQLIKVQGAKQPARWEATLLLQGALLDVYRQDAAQQGHAPLQPDPRIARVLTVLHTRPSARPSLVGMAAEAGLSPDYFSRLFKRETGESFRAYTLRARLERGRHLLTESNLSVSEVAWALGYDDVFFFSRQFAKHYRVPPSKAEKRFI